MHNPLYPYPTDGALGFRPTPPARASQRLLRRLRQSVGGLRTAAKLAVSPKTHDLALSAANRRAELEQKVTRMIAERNGDVSPTADVAGRVHRIWMRFVTSTTDDRLLAEMDRGEASAERAARRAVPRFDGLSGGRSGDHLLDLLSRVVDEIAATRDEISRLREARVSDPEPNHSSQEPNWHRRAV